MKLNPSYYADRGLRCPQCNVPVETVEVILGWKLDWLLGHVVKYTSRAGLKPGEPKTEALHKALWFLQRAIYEVDSLIPPEERDG